MPTPAAGGLPGVARVRQWRGRDDGHRRANAPLTTAAWSRLYTDMSASA